ncbi:MAG: fibronectin type III domain-containing protein [Gemmatimonadota bacterium]|nr:fibronectin type III domain-containing protein [Gemmatimonadota bacterium]
MPFVRSRKLEIGLFASVLAVMSTSVIHPETGNDLPVGGQEDAKLRSIQEIFGGECCARDAGKDIDGLAAAGNNDPEGIWSDGTTMWVADKADQKLYAYDLASGARAADKDFDTLAAAGNRNPEGIWSDGATMWVADDPWFGEKVYAYDMSTGARNADKDINLLERNGNDNPEGIWSNDTTMWVADYTDARLYAYDMELEVADLGKDVSALGFAGNNHPQGIWSDGKTMWVADYADAKIYAYNLTHYGRSPFLDVNSLNAAGNSHPVGIWSNGTTMWVADDVDKKLYAYNLTLRTDAPAILSVTAGTGSLTLSWRVPPIETGTVVITGYDVRYIRSDAPDKAEASWTVLRYVRTTGSGTLYYEVTGLSGGAGYDLQLRAVTNRGPGSWSAVRNGTPLVQGQSQASTDFNGDGRTDFVDFFLFADAYGSTNPKFDLDGSGIVDFADFFKFVDAFGT